MHIITFSKSRTPVASRPVLTNAGSVDADGHKRPLRWNALIERYICELPDGRVLKWTEEEAQALAKPSRGTLHTISISQPAAMLDAYAALAGGNLSAGLERAATLPHVDVITTEGPCKATSASLSPEAHAFYAAKGGGVFAAGVRAHCRSMTHQVTMGHDLHQALQVLGGGNLSEGVRIVAENYFGAGG